MISVIVPAYNAAGTIKHCLNSLLNQDFVDYEIIVTDDGSNDPLAIYAKSICGSRKTSDISGKKMRVLLQQEITGLEMQRANILHLWIQMIM